MKIVRVILGCSGCCGPFFFARVLDYTGYNQYNCSCFNLDLDLASAVRKDIIFLLFVIDKHSNDCYIY